MQIIYLMHKKKTLNNNGICIRICILCQFPDQKNISEAPLCLKAKGVTFRSHHGWDNDVLYVNSLSGDASVHHTRGAR